MDGNEYASIMTDKNRRQTFCDGGEEEFLRLASLHMRWISSSHAAITKERNEALAKLEAMENQKPVAYVESVDRLGYPDRLGYQERINGLHADRKFSIGDHLYSKPVPADKPGYKAIKRTDLPSNANRDHMLNEAANRADYFFRQIDGSYKFHAPDGQVYQVIEMLLAAANMPADKPAVGISKMEKSTPSHSQQSDDPISMAFSAKDLLEIISRFSFYAGSDAGLLVDSWINSGEAKGLIYLINDRLCEIYNSHRMNPFWESEAKRAFWNGLEIGAGMGNVSILPRWNEYIEKRKCELLNRCPSHESEQPNISADGYEDETMMIDGEYNE